MDNLNKAVSTSVRNFYARGLYTIENGVTKTPTQRYSNKKVNSLYGTSSLSYHDYLFLNATARNDWFSTLNPKSNSYLYPSVGASFLFSEALKNMMPSWWNYGKLRISYAEVGGDTNPYESTVYYSLQSNAFDGTCLLYTSDAADDLLCVDLGGRLILTKKKTTTIIYYDLFTSYLLLKPPHH